MPSTMLDPGNEWPSKSQALGLPRNSFIQQIFSYVSIVSPYSAGHHKSSGQGSLLGETPSDLLCLCHVIHARTELHAGFYGSRKKELLNST